MQKIIVEVIVNSDIGNVWKNWIDPEDLKNWCHASDDGFVSYAENDLKVGGKFLTRMSSRGGTDVFDFTGVYDEVVECSKISYSTEDDRKVEIVFEKIDDTQTRVIETFDSEDENPIEMQRDGWQAILNNFKKYVENKN